MGPAEQEERARPGGRLPAESAGRGVGERGRLASLSRIGAWKAWAAAGSLVPRKTCDSINRAVPSLCRKRQPSLLAHGLEIVLGIGAAIIGIAVADLPNRQQFGLAGAVDELVRRSAGTEARAHPGLEREFALFGAQDRRAAEDIDELFLVAVPVEQRRLPPGSAWSD